MSNQSKVDLNVVDVDAAASSDPLDLAKLRITPEMMEGAAVKKLLTTVPVRKPNAQDFIRVRRELPYRETLALIELRDERETFVIDLNAVPELRNECFFATCFTAITRTGTLFLWPVKVPASDGKALEWHTSAAVAAQHAMKGWVRVKADMGLGAYVIYEAAGSIPEPEWPDLSFDEILRLAFKDKIVRSLEHPVVKRLRGE